MRRRVAFAHTLTPDGNLCAQRELFLHLAEQASLAQPPFGFALEPVAEISFSVS